MLNKKLFQFIGLAVLVSLFGCTVSSPNLNSSSQENLEREYEAVYYSPEETSLVALDELESANVLFVNAFQDLSDEVSNSNIRVIYLDPVAFEEIDASWLSEQYENGIVIAALNTPISQLGEKVGSRAGEVDDIDLEKSYGRIGVSAVQEEHEPDVSSSYAQLSEYFEDFAMVADIIQRNFLTEATQ